MNLNIQGNFQICISVPLRRENTQSENMYNNVFEKAKRRAGKAEVFM